MIASALSGEVKDYLAFEAIESGTFTLTIPSGLATSALEYVRYSTDGGATWETIKNVDSQQVVITTPTIAAGDKVLWRGKGSKYANNTSAYSNFSSTGKYNVSGNIMSLLHDSSFEDKVAFTQTDVFVYLFKNGKIVSAADLLLPATTLTESCYNFMFNACTEMTNGPAELPATTPKAYCYQRMFNYCPKMESAPVIQLQTLITACCNYMFANCGKLAYVKAMFLTEPSTSYTNAWLSNVAASGTFVKNAAATWDVSGSSGIPTGWTVETASE